MPHGRREVRMRVAGWVLGVLALGVIAGFAAGLLRPRRYEDYHSFYESPTPSPAGAAPGSGR